MPTCCYTIISTQHHGEIFLKQGPTFSNEIFEAVCLRTIERGEIQDERETSEKEYTQMCKQMTRKTTTNLVFTKRRIQQKWNSVEETSPENSLSNTGRHDNHDLKYTPVLMCKDPS